MEGTFPHSEPNLVGMGKSQQRTYYTTWCPDVSAINGKRRIVPPAGPGRAAVRGVRGRLTRYHGDDNAAEVGDMTISEVRTWPGSGVGRCNEDCARVDLETGCGVLVDGATGLSKSRLTDMASDAAWYAQALVEETSRDLADQDRSLDEALLAAGTRVARSYMSLPGASRAERIDYPNGSLAAVRWRADRIEVASLGDASTVVVMRGGAHVVLHDATLDALDRLNYERMFRYATERGASMREAREALNDRFVEHRLLMNEPNGYWAVDVTCRGYGHEWRFEAPRSQVRGVVMCSDGFAAAVDMGVVDDLVELADLVMSGAGERLGGDLRAAEREDEDCLRVHRSKTSDDATYAAIWF